MKPQLKKLLSYSLLIIIVALFVYYIKNNISDFKQLSLVNPLYILPLLIIALLIAIINGLVLKYLTEPFGIKMKFKEWFGLSVVTSFYNTITPMKGGLIAKAGYLKTKHKLPYTNFIAMWSGVYVINFFVGSLLGLISMAFIYFKYQIFNWLVFLIFLGFFIPLLFVILFSPKFPESKNKWLNRFINVLNGWNLIKSHKRVVFAVSLAIIFSMFLSAISTIIAYSIFGIQITFFKALFLGSIGILAVLVAVTPSGLGIQEAIAVFSALIIGITPSQSLTVAILGRVIALLWILTLGPIFSYILFKSIKPKSQKK